MRIIAGQYKHRRFEVPQSFQARPTTDFAKENLFNVLQSYIDFSEEGVRALDLFSGTGSIALELASRGCGEVISIEGKKSHHAFIRKCIATTGITQINAYCTDVFRYLKRGNYTPFDFIFADPPYALAELHTLPDLLTNAPLHPDGLLVLEHGRSHSFQTHPCFIEEREYGSVHFSFFRHAKAVSAIQ